MVASKIANVSFPGITKVKGATYTQGYGTKPGEIEIRLVPQSLASVAAIGTVTFTYDGTSITLPDCMAEKSSAVFNAQGYVTAITLQDRRWRWQRAAAIYGHHNEFDATGAIRSDSLLDLRTMIQRLCTAIGEPFANVIVPANFYPEFDVLNDRPADALQTMCDEYGLVICLGFNSEAITVCPRGQQVFGNSVSTADMMAQSSGYQPARPHAYYETCFGPSEYQSQFVTAPVGVDTDGAIKNIYDLSYQPSGGWSRCSPKNMANVLNEHGALAYQLARKSVFRWYIVAGFAGIGNFAPGYGPVLMHQIFPFMEKLLEYQRNLTGEVTHPPIRVYGSHARYESRGDFIRNDAPVRTGFVWDRYHGICKFNRPVFKVFDYGIEPADILIEAAYKIRNLSFRNFETARFLDLVNASGEGVRTTNVPNINRKFIYQQGAFSISDNYSVLANYRDQLNIALNSFNVDKAPQMVWGNKLLPWLRLDGQVNQIRHVISDGDDGEAGSYTVASLGAELNAFGVNAFTRTAQRYAAQQQATYLGRRARQNRVVKGQD
jgi:hypothetical protein